MEKPIKIEKIWVELDEFIYPEGEIPHENYCNVEVYLSDGSFFSLNVWSEELFYEEITKLEWINNQVAYLPDLVIRKFDSESIRKTILELDEEENWFRGRGYPAIPDEDEEE